MNRHDYAVLTLRGFAIYAWFSSLQYFTNGFLLFNQIYYRPSFGINFASFFIPAAINFFLGLYLFMRSAKLASWLMPAQESEPPGQLPSDPLAAASLAFAAVGVAIFLHALPGVLVPLFASMQVKQAASEHVTGYYNDAAHIFGVSCQLILGFTLFIKSRAFAASWWRKQ